MSLIYTSYIKSDTDRTATLARNMPTGVQEVLANVNKLNGTGAAPGSFPAYRYAQDPNKATQAVTPSDNLVEATCLWLRSEHGTNIEINDVQLGDDVRRHIQRLRGHSPIDPDTIFDLSPSAVFSADNKPSRFGTSTSMVDNPASAVDRAWRGVSSPAPSDAAQTHMRAARGFTPSPSTLDVETHQLRVLTGMVKDLKVPESDKFDPEVSSLNAYRRTLERLFDPVPGSVDVVFGRSPTYAEKDAAIRTVLMRTLSAALVRDWDAEHCQARALSASEVFDWIVQKCNVGTRNRRHRLLKDALDLVWDGRPETARAFLQGWQNKVIALNDVLETPWSPQARLDLLRTALTGNSSHFVAPFVSLDRDLRAGRVLNDAVLDAFFTELLAIATDAAGDKEEPDAASPVALQTTANMRRLRSCFACGEWDHVVRECKDRAAVRRFESTRLRATPAALPSATAKLALYVADATSESDTDEGYASAGSNASH